MAGLKISALPSIPSLADADLFPVVQGSNTYKATLVQLTDYIITPANIRLSTTSNLNATYNNGASGVGATLVNAGALAALSIDSVAVQSGDRILVKDQATTYQNGIYVVTTVGDGSTAWVLTRGVDYDNPGEIDPGDFFTVYAGTINAKTQWIQTETITTVGSDAILFESNLVAGVNVLKVNNTISATGNTTWVEVTGVSENMSSNIQYLTNNAGLVSLLLPSTSGIGDIVSIVGKGAGGWRITQGAGQQVNVGGSATTLGAGGSVSSAGQFDSIQLVCTVADTIWTTRSAPQSAGLIIV